MAAHSLSIKSNICRSTLVTDKSGLPLHARDMEGRRMRSWLLLLGLCVIYLFCGNAAVAQSTGTIRGVVKDPAGAVLPNATVFLINTGTDRKLQATTNAVGSYDFTFLPPGQYQVTVDVSGFSSFRRDKIPVDVDSVAGFDVVF